MEDKLETIKELMENAKYIGYLTAKNDIFKFVWELHKQGKISDDLAQLFVLELGFDLE